MCVTVPEQFSQQEREAEDTSMALQQWLESIIEYSKAPIIYSFRSISEINHIFGEHP
jgi:hypothetical protein